MSCFFFNDTATTEIYTLSLHDALPIWRALGRENTCNPREIVTDRLKSYPGALRDMRREGELWRFTRHRRGRDRKSTRLNSSHANISYAVFCLKKKKHSQYTLRLISLIN